MELWQLSKTLSSNFIGCFFIILVRFIKTWHPFTIKRSVLHNFWWEIPFSLIDFVNQTVRIDVNNTFLLSADRQDLSDGDYDDFKSHCNPFFSKPLLEAFREAFWWPVSHRSLMDDYVEKVLDSDEDICKRKSVIWIYQDAPVYLFRVYSFFYFDLIPFSEAQPLVTVDPIKLSL